MPILSNLTFFLNLNKKVLRIIRWKTGPCKIRIRRIRGIRFFIRQKKKNYFGGLKYLILLQPLNVED